MMGKIRDSGWGRCASFACMFDPRRIPRPLNPSNAPPLGSADLPLRFAERRDDLPPLGHETIRQKWEGIRSAGTGFDMISVGT